MSITTPTNTTYQANLINPQVLAPIIEQKFVDYMKFAPLAMMDTTLVGIPGDTVTLPNYRYIGDATVVPEGNDIPIAELNQDTRQVTISKTGKGVVLTDEAILRGYGNPVGEAVNQIALAMASKTDNDVLSTLDDIPALMTVDYESDVAISSDLFADALLKFGEDELGDKVALVSPTMLNTLRKSESWIPVTEIGVQVLMSGVMGMIWGCQIVVSNKITHTFYIVKPGALAIFMKRGIISETLRVPSNQSTEYYATKHYVTYLYDESKAISVRHVVKATPTVTTITIAPSATEDASVAVVPTDATVAYEVDDTDIATVNTAGLVTGVAVGEAVLTVTISHDDYATRVILIPITIEA